MKKIFKFADHLKKGLDFSGSSEFHSSRENILGNMKVLNDLIDNDYLDNLNKDGIEYFDKSLERLLSTLGDNEGHNPIEEQVDKDPDELSDEDVSEEFKGQNPARYEDWDD